MCTNLVIIIIIIINIIKYIYIENRAMQPMRYWFIGNVYLFLCATNSFLVNNDFE